MIMKQPTKNLHQEHIEDGILTGDKTPLLWLNALQKSHISTKIDGAPAIVWGRNPATGNQFVGTKSVFNKVKIKINETHNDIDINHGHTPKVAAILHTCFDNLPSTSNIYQGEFIGEGGTNEYTANTITYKFDEVINHNIIIAPHTIYYAKNDLREATSQPLCNKLVKDDYVMWIQPDAWFTDNEDIEDMLKFANQISTLCEFVSDRKAVQIKKCINTFIREDRELDDDELSNVADCDINLIRYWKLIKAIKDDMLQIIDNNGPDAYIGYNRIEGEGYTLTNKFGTYKLVNRECFSKYNFVMGIR